VDDRVTHFDKYGMPVELRVADASVLPELLDMYDGFEPKPASQGLPPSNPTACRSWVAFLLDSGVNLCAHRCDRLIGHAAILIDPAKCDAEFLIFVHQDFRSKGIGTILTRRTLELARDRGIGCVWLTVETVNFHAVRLYRNIGFQFCDAFDCERMMRIDIEGP